MIGQYLSNTNESASVNFAKFFGTKQGLILREHVPVPLRKKNCIQAYTPCPRSSACSIRALPIGVVVVGWWLGATASPSGVLAAGFACGPRVIAARSLAAGTGIGSGLAVSPAWPSIPRLVAWWLRLPCPSLFQKKRSTSDGDLYMLVQTNHNGVDNAVPCPCITYHH